MRVSIGVVFAILTGFVGLTYAALEWDGVAVITTTQEGGTSRQTHIWFVEHDGDLSVEAGTPENPWFQDVLENPVVQVVTADMTGTFTALPQPNPEGHQTIRTLLREKYGLRDWWVGILFNTSQSVHVTLTPLDQ